jgi:hypothetical protein
MVTPRVACLPKWKESCRDFIFYWMAMGDTVCFLSFTDHLTLSLLFGHHPLLPQSFGKLIKMEER